MKMISVLLFLSATGTGQRPSWLPEDAFALNQARAVNKQVNGGFSSVAFSADAKVVLFAGDSRGGRNAKLWAHQSDKVLGTLEHAESGSFVAAFSPDGTMIGTSGQNDKFRGIIKLFNATTLKEKHSFEIPDGSTEFVFTPDSKMLVTGGGYRASCLYIWELSPFKERAKLLIASGYVSKVAVSPDGKTIASGTNKGWVYLWDLETGKQKAAWQAFRGHLTALDFAPDGKTLAAGAEDTEARDPSESEPGPGNPKYSYRFWDIAAAKEKGDLLLPRRENKVSLVKAMRYSPDGKLLAIAPGGGGLLFLNAKTGKIAGMLGGHEDAVLCFAFSSDGKLVATGSQDRTVRIWELPEPK